MILIPGDQIDNSIEINDETKELIWSIVENRLDVNKEYCPDCLVLIVDCKSKTIESPFSRYPSP